MALANGKQNENTTGLKPVINVGGQENTQLVDTENVLKVSEVFKPLIWLYGCQVSIRDVGKALNTIMIEQNKMNELGYCGVWTQYNRQTSAVELYVVFDVNKCPLISGGTTGHENLLRAIANKMDRSELDLEGLFKKLNGVIFYLTDSSKMRILSDENNGNKTIAIKCEFEDVLYSIHGYSVLDETDRAQIHNIRQFKNEQSHKAEDTILVYEIEDFEGVEKICNRYGNKFRGNKAKQRFSGSIETL